MQYELDREKDTAGEPHIAEMTRAAITRLSQDTDGYVLMVEGGRIDHGHHAGNAIRALEDTMAFDLAIATALEMTNAEDTLILVTADHSHTLTIAGYAQRNNPILGLSVSGMGGEGGSAGADGLPYTTLGYINGPGACRETGKDEAGKPQYDCTRQDLTSVDTLAPDFRQPALVPMYSETHAGEDVAALASGPGAHLVSGVIEQSEIFHVLARALGLVPPPTE
jgi:alkaline phosphatase